MTAILPILLGIALASVLLTLLVGVAVMTRGGEIDRRFGNKLMRLRVAVQLIAVILFVLLVLSSRGQI